MSGELSAGLVVKLGSGFHVVEGFFVFSDEGELEWKALVMSNRFDPEEVSLEFADPEIHFFASWEEMNDSERAQVLSFLSRVLEQKIESLLTVEEEALN